MFEKTTSKTTAKITIKTTSKPLKSDIVTSEPEKVDTIVTTKVTEKTETKTEVPKTSDATEIGTVPAETTAVYGTTVNCTNEEISHTTVKATTKVENTANTENTSTETTTVVSPWNYTIVTYNGQNYYFDGNQTTYEGTQYYLGPYKIYNQNLRDYITKDTYFIDDYSVAVEINSVLYTYSR